MPWMSASGASVVDLRAERYMIPVQHLLPRLVCLEPSLRAEHKGVWAKRYGGAVDHKWTDSDLDPCKQNESVWDCPLKVEDSPAGRK